MKKIVSPLFQDLSEAELDTLAAAGHLRTRQFAKHEVIFRAGSCVREIGTTCAPSNIRYPQDVSLLNKARESAEKLLDVLHDPAEGKKPRTYRQRARKDYLKYVRCRKHTAKMTRKAIGKQLAYLRRDLDAIDGKLSIGKNLPPRQTERLGTIRTVYEQQKYMYDNRTHSVPDRIVSVSQPFIRPIVRGKAGKPVEFGAKLDISVVDGWTRLECCSFDAYNEAGNLREMAERLRAREATFTPLPPHTT